MDSSLIHSLTKVEYLITFNAFIYGYILSRFFSGWGRIISNRRNIIFSIEHILWSVFAFFMLLSLWWYSWLDLGGITQRSLSFYASIVSPFLMYMISSLYFPPISEGKITNLGRDSKFQRRQSAVLYFILYLFHLIRAIFVGVRVEAIAYFIVGLIVCVIVFYSRKRWIGQANLAIAFIVIVIYMINIPSFVDTELWMLDDFSFSEYLVTFITFVYGFIVAKFLEGWTFFLKNRRSIRFNIEYILWTLLVFGLIVDYWWGLYERSLPSSRNFGYFVLSLMVPIGFYLLASLLFSTGTISALRSQDNFTRNHKLIFGAFLSIFLFDFVGSLIIKSRDLIDVENLFLLFAVILCCSAIIRDSFRLQRAVLILGWILLMAHNLI
jgi:hypothetical protein